MEYTCELCNFRTNRINNLKAHNITIKHLRKEGEIEFEKHQKSKNINIAETIVTENDDICDDTKCEKQENVTILKTKNDKQSMTNIEKKPKKIYKCSCNKTFSCYQNMWRHRNKCDGCSVTANLIHSNNNELAEIKQTMQNLTNVIKSLTVPSTVVTPQPININMTTNTNSNNTNNIGNTLNMMSAIKYINENYLNTPPLNMLEPQSAKNLLLAQASDKHSAEEFMVYYYDKNLFHKFVGEIIKDEYKQENPEEQQFWTTDVSRLSFVVRRVMQENESKWIKEPEGKMVKKYIVSPILIEVKKMVDEYHTYCKEKIRINKNTLKLLEMEKLLDSSITCDKISSDIGNQLFDDPVLRYIAPHFKLDL